MTGAFSQSRLIVSGSYPINFARGPAQLSVCLRAGKKLTKKATLRRYCYIVRGNDEEAKKQILNSLMFPTSNSY
jgi:hypothetical protein